jgi:hypothetical protein
MRLAEHAAVDAAMTKNGVPITLRRRTSRASAARHAAGERLHHAMLAIDGVRRRQQLAGGFLRRT